MIGTRGERPSGCSRPHHAISLPHIAIDPRAERPQPPRVPLHLRPRRVFPALRRAADQRNRPLRQMRQQRFAPAPEAQQERGGRQRIAVNDRLRHAQQRVRRQPRQARIRVSPRLGGLQERITRAGSVGKSAQSALDAFADVRQRGIIHLSRSRASSSVSSASGRCR